jgi:hypothetical protein
MFSLGDYEAIAVRLRARAAAPGGSSGPPLPALAACVFILIPPPAGCCASYGLQWVAAGRSSLGASRFAPFAQGRGPSAPKGGSLSGIVCALGLRPLVDRRVLRFLRAQPVYLILSASCSLYGVDRYCLTNYSY